MDDFWRGKTEVTETIRKHREKLWRGIDRGRRIVLFSIEIEIVEERIVFDLFVNRRMLGLF